MVNQAAAAGAATFGIDPTDDLVLLSQPAGRPGYGENFAFWIFATDGSVYINTHMNSVDSFWPVRRETISLCLPDGRAFVEMNEGWRVAGDSVGAAGLVMTCVEPMKRWRLEFKGTLRETSQAALAAGPLPDGSGRRTLLDWDAEIYCDGPILRQGGTAATWRSMNESAAARYIGGDRYEQLFRADVRLRVPGEPELRFAATGTRTHRRGERNVAGYAGHDWQSARFPNGDGFTLMRFRRPDGGLEWDEAYLVSAGRVVPASIESDNWITRRQASGDRLIVRLRSELGDSEISGVVAGSIFRSMNTSPGNPLIARHGVFGRRFGFESEPPGMLGMQQACVRYTMAGQSTFGMAERSNFVDQFDPQ
jgi:hypothetical protein